MSLEDLGNIGELIAAIGVIASLVYLAVQIRANTNQVRSAEHHRFRDETSRLHEIALSSREHAELLTKMANNGELSPVERTCAYAFADRMTNHWLATETAYQLGTIPKDYYENMCIEVRNVTSRLPITRKYIRRIVGIHPTARDLPIFRPIFEDGNQDAVETAD
jgi:hypothetical protein